MEYISNPITAEDLIALFHSKLYQDLLEKYIGVIPTKFTETSADNQISKYLQRKYLILNIPIEEVIAMLKSDKEEFINYCIQRKKFYDNYNENSNINEDKKVEQHEEISKNERKIDERARNFLLHNFCEYFLLKINDTERTIRFLKRTKMPYPIKHLSEIENIYHRVLHD